MGDDMTKYIATLHKTVEVNIVFESTDMQYGTKLPEYSVPHTFAPGPRQFRTVKAAKDWVASFNKEYGEGTASYIGKP